MWLALLAWGVLGAAPPPAAKTVLAAVPAQVPSLAAPVVDNRVRLMGGPAPFALDPGFVEVVPGVPISVEVSGASDDEELILDVVRLGALGKGRTRLAVSVDGTKRVLGVLATTQEQRPVGKAWASRPVRQRLPLPPGPAPRRALVVVVAQDPIALRVSLGPRLPDTEIDLEPLGRPGAPGSDEIITEAEPEPEPAPPPAADPGPAEPPAVVLPTPAAPSAPPENNMPRFSVELRAGGSAVVGGLQPLVPAAGVRVLVGPRKLDAGLGLAADVDVQGGEQKGGRWDATVARARVEGKFGIVPLPLLDVKLAVAVGVGGRFAWHHAAAPGAVRSVFVFGGTARIGPELSLGAGPGRLAVELPVDVSFDAPGAVRNFAPVAGGLLVGYRLEL